MNAWVRYPRPQSEAAIRLFCLPAAGGGVSPFRPWVALGRSDVELAPIRLPGREGRAHERPIRDVDLLVERLARAVKSELRGPYAIFGHSTGALIAFELTRSLATANVPQPLALCVAAQPAPHLAKLPPVSSLPTPDLLRFLERISGTPPSVLADLEVLELVLPAVRADFALHETHIWSPGITLDRPILAFAGSDDRYVPRAAVDAWRDITTGGFKLMVLQGDHFFVHRHGREILDVIVRRCLAQLQGTPTSTDAGGSRLPEG